MPYFEEGTLDNSKVTKALKQFSKTATKWTQIDVDQAAQKARVDRALVVRKLQEWNDCGAIELQPSGVVNRFRILKSFAQDATGKDEIVPAIYTYFQTSEKDSISRVHDVIGLLTGSKCISRGLAKHFGDEDSVAKRGCGHCSFCIHKVPVLFDLSKSKSRKGRITTVKVKAILAATNVRDDPRFLARVAFGISSPRVTIQKLLRHPVFGSMDDCDFDVGSSLFVLGPQLTLCRRSSLLVSRKPVIIRLVGNYNGYSYSYASMIWL